MKQAKQKLVWFPTRAAMSERYDDIWFVTTETGWAVNSNGEILRTDDRGLSWTVQHSVRHEPIWMRSICFSEPGQGWAGAALDESEPTSRLQQAILYHTRDGEKWHRVHNLPDNAPPLICGLWPACNDVIYAAGTAQLDAGAHMMMTTDGGKTWQAWSMEEYASMLIDVYFPSPDRGWVVGGIVDLEKCPFKSSGNDMVNPNVVPVVLYTSDGCATWTNQVHDLLPSLPCGEWGWKIQFIDELNGFVSLESASRAAILKTCTGGKSWQVKTVQGNANIQGVGFANELHGWVGGWGPLVNNQYTGMSSVTYDGGNEWQHDDRIGKNINRFWFARGDAKTAGYSAGETVYQCRRVSPSAPPPPRSHQYVNFQASTTSGDAIAIKYHVPEKTRRVTVYVWDRFGKLVRRLLDQRDPAPGRHEVDWHGTGERGQPVPSGPYMLRLIEDGVAESVVISLVRKS